MFFEYFITHLSFSLALTSVVVQSCLFCSRLWTGLIRVTPISVVWLERRVFGLPTSDLRVQPRNIGVSKLLVYTRNWLFARCFATRLVVREAWIQLKYTFSTLFFHFCDIDILDKRSFIPENLLLHTWRFCSWFKKRIIIAQICGRILRCTHLLQIPRIFTLSASTNH